MCVCIYTFACPIQVYSMDSLPLKMPQGAPQKVNEDIQDIIVPDYLSILQETDVSIYVNMSWWDTQSLCYALALFDHFFPVLEVAQHRVSLFSPTEVNYIHIGTAILNINQTDVALLDIKGRCDTIVSPIFPGLCVDSYLLKGSGKTNALSYRLYP